MKAFLLLLILANGDTRSGLDVLAESGCAILKGKRVGLVTNHTGCDRSGKSIIDIVHGAEGVRLTALFSPEHGIRGTEDKQVASGKDAKTGLPVYSLYGSTKRPKPEWLKEVDVLVFDIQDIGTRFYTYITTMAYCMEAAKENGKEMIILDRPNTIGGKIVEGPVLEKKLLGGFASYFPIPTRHGMTVAELARWYNAEFKVGCNLRVIEMKGWKRSMYFDETGLPWIDPSPNMNTLDGAINYPGLGALEATNLSVGRGTKTPFEHYGAPWVDSEKLVRNLNARGLKGVKFVATTFTPRLIPGRHRYPFTDETCRGFRVRITDRSQYRPLAAVIHVLDALHDLHPDKFQIGRAPNMIGLSDIGDRIKRGDSPADIVSSWRKDLDSFLKTRNKYLLYE